MDDSDRLMIKADNRTDCRGQTALVIPSLDPDEKFQAVIDSLLRSGFTKLVIVDDGSDAAHQKWFFEA